MQNECSSLPCCMRVAWECNKWKTIVSDRKEANVEFKTCKIRIFKSTMEQLCKFSIFIHYLQFISVDADIEVFHFHTLTRMLKDDSARVRVWMDWKFNRKFSLDFNIDFIAFRKQHNNMNCSLKSKTSRGIQLREESHENFVWSGLENFTAISQFLHLSRMINCHLQNTTFSRE
jgi:hypothetical protein